MTADTTPPRALIVDDDEQVLFVHQRVLKMGGFDVETAASGNAAMDALRRTQFDVVLSDIDMPGMDGIRLLEQVRSHDVDVPVILITGAPTLETAVQALDRGALRYLSKPTPLPELLKVARDAVRLHRIAKAKREALALLDGAGHFAGDHAGLKVSFERAMDTMRMAYQPIVSWSKRSVVAYEALLRSSEPNLPSPAAVLDAAERLDRVHALGRRLRSLAVSSIDRLPHSATLFLNIHPHDLLDEELHNPRGEIARAAERVTLEVTERASLETVEDVRTRLASIRQRGFRLALDDFGAGFGGLTSFALLEPEVVKIDNRLVRGIEREPVKWNLVKTMTNMCNELGITVIAEGIETVAERDEIARAGCDLMQGYLFAAPSETFGTVAF
ncbi:MAG: EAL domain-containing response regulator [Vicinamibacterales bacterium]